MEHATASSGAPCATAVSKRAPRPARARGGGCVRVGVAVAAQPVARRVRWVTSGRRGALRGRRAGSAARSRGESGHGETRPPDRAPSSRRAPSRAWSHRHGRGTARRTPTLASAHDPSVPAAADPRLVAPAGPAPAQRIGRFWSRPVVQRHPRPLSARAWGRRPAARPVVRRCFAPARVGGAGRAIRMLRSAEAGAAAAWPARRRDGARELPRAQVQSHAALAGASVRRGRAAAPRWRRRRGPGAPPRAAPRAVASPVPRSPRGARRATRRRHATGVGGVEQTETARRRTWGPHRTAARSSRSASLPRPCAEATVARAAWTTAGDHRDPRRGCGRRRARARRPGAPRRRQQAASAPSEGGAPAPRLQRLARAASACCVRAARASLPGFRLRTPPPTGTRVSAASSRRGGTGPRTGSAGPARSSAADVTEGLKAGPRGVVDVRRAGVCRGCRVAAAQRTPHGRPGPPRAPAAAAPQRRAPSMALSREARPRAARWGRCRAGPRSRPVRGPQAARPRGQGPRPPQPPCRRAGAGGGGTGQGAGSSTRPRSRGRSHGRSRRHPGVRRSRGGQPARASSTSTWPLDGSAARTGSFTKRWETVSNASGTRGEVGALLAQEPRRHGHVRARPRQDGRQGAIGCRSARHRRGPHPGRRGARERRPRRSAGEPRSRPVPAGPAAA